MECPKEFYNNCENAIYKCSICRAGNGRPTNPIYYSPIIGNNSLKKSKHPLYHKKPNTDDKKKPNKQISKYVKSGLKEERRLVNRIAKQTVRSGAVYGDGDIDILDGELKLDSKKRHKTESFTVTKAEYEKGKRQGLDGWVITNKNNDSVYVLTEETFIRLVGAELARQQKGD